MQGENILSVLCTHTVIFFAFLLLWLCFVGVYAFLRLPPCAFYLVLRGEMTRCLSLFFVVCKGCFPFIGVYDYY